MPALLDGELVSSCSCSTDRVSTRARAPDRRLARRPASPRRVAREPSWPHSAEEDYIVFRFGRDGAFDVVKPRAAGSKHRGGGGVGDVGASLPPTDHRKEVGDAVAVEDYREESRGNSEDDGYDSDDDCSEVEEEVNTDYVDSDSSTTNREDNKSDDSRGWTALPESVGSNGSDDSTTSSFAFPILRWEWVGSPIKMPRPEKSRLRKIKARCASCSICC